MNGSQKAAFYSPYDETFLFGTRGGGKSVCQLSFLAAPVGQGLGSSYKAIVFRREHKDLAQLVSESQKLYYEYFKGAKFLDSKLCWIFKDG